MCISVHSTENHLEHIHVLNLYALVRVSSEIIMAEALKEREEILNEGFLILFGLLSGFFPLINTLDSEELQAAVETKIRKG